VKDMTGVGEMLRNAREDQGLSYQDAEQVIKIRAAYLKAIEEERFDALPGTAYAKGFLRSYAKYLHLDDDAVIAAYTASSSALPEENVTLGRKPLQTAPSVFSRSALIVTAVIAVALVVFLSLYFNASWPSASPNIGINEAGPDDPETLPEPEPEPEPETPAKPEEPPIAEGLVVEVAYFAPCWLDVRADGEPVFSGTKGEGESLRIEANEYIEFVSIGASESIAITKNGELLPAFTEHVVRNFRVEADVPRQPEPEAPPDFEEENFGTN
jgi:transcriptional regulator with XRE-family HTH domain